MDAKGRWSESKAWDYYKKRKWLRGCNYLGSDCVNLLDQWQKDGFDCKLETVKRELSLAKETGYNSIRIFPDFYVWTCDRKGFFERFEAFLDIAGENNISCMPVLGNDCVPSLDENYVKPHLGKQEFELGYHGGKRLAMFSLEMKQGHSLIDEEEYHEQYFEWISEMISRYKDDERICIWDMYNEAGNCLRDEITLPILKKIFDIARNINPQQPLTSCIWRWSDDSYAEISQIERYCAESSDIISYHYYGNYESNIKILKKLKKYSRPIINTEWLARMFGNTVEELFPLFYLEDIGCYNWGFVAGLNQTYEPWEVVWETYKENPGIDFTKWFHDLYRPSLRPYNPKEIEIIKKFTELSDTEFESRNIT